MTDKAAQGVDAPNKPKSLLKSEDCVASLPKTEGTGTGTGTGTSLSVRILECDGSIKVPEKLSTVSSNDGALLAKSGTKRDRREPKSQKRRLVKRIVAGVAISLIAMCFVLVAVMLHLSRHIDDSASKRTTATPVSTQQSTVTSSA